MKKALLLAILTLISWNVTGTGQTMFEEWSKLGESKGVPTTPQIPRNEYTIFSAGSGHRNKTMRGRLEDLTLEYVLKYVAPNYTRAEKLKKLAEHYKIHLMPKSGDEERVVIALLDAIKDDPSLAPLIEEFKVSNNPTLKNLDSQNATLPVIVIYAAAGKENVQELLNKLYVIFENTEGSNIKPRKNAKVTSLIWIAQGDADYKWGGYTDYFEPGLVYYNPTNMGEPDANYYMIHPKTGEEILPTEEDIEALKEDDDSESSSSSSESDDDNDEPISRASSSQSSRQLSVTGRAQRDRRPVQQTRGRLQRSETQARFFPSGK